MSKHAKTCFNQQKERLVSFTGPACFLEVEENCRRKLKYRTTHRHCRCSFPVPPKPACSMLILFRRENSWTISISEMLTKRPTFPPFFSTKWITLTKNSRKGATDAPTRHAHRGIHELVPLKLLVQSVTLVLIRFRACGCWPYFTEIRLLRERKDLAGDQGPSKLPVTYMAIRPAGAAQVDCKDTYRVSMLHDCYGFNRREIPFRLNWNLMSPLSPGKRDEECFMS